jgi:hypothetical protein
MRRAAAPIAATSTFAVLGLSMLVASMSGCGEKLKYKPEPAYSGPKASLPKPPAIPSPATFKEGSAWTIYGLQHQLANPRHRPEVDMKGATITGYVVDIYKPKEPEGKEGCIYPQKKHPPTSKEPTPKGVACDTVKYEPPHFYIADSKDEKNPAKMVTVMGYASSYIQQAMAIDFYKKHPEVKIESSKEEDLYMDNNYSSYITILGEPKIGSKVTITGLFGTKYEEGQGGRRTVPYGIIDITSHKKGKIDCTDCMEQLELK